MKEFVVGFGKDAVYSITEFKIVELTFTEFGRFAENYCRRLTAF